MVCSIDKDVEYGSHEKGTNLTLPLFSWDMLVKLTCKRRENVLAAKETNKKRE